VPEKIEHLQSEKWWLRGIQNTLSFLKISYLDSAKKKCAVSGIKLYGINDLDALNLLPEVYASEVNFYRPLLSKGISHYIDNISAELKLLKIDNEIFPMLITSGNYDNSYVCSPYANYYLIAIQNLQKIKSRFFKTIGTIGLSLYGNILKVGAINSVIYLNHSLLSTDLQNDDLSEEQIEQIVSILKSKYPKHSIVFRSINSQTCPELTRVLKTNGFNFIASRYIYLTDTKNADLFQTRILKSDLKLWKEKTYEVVEGKDFNAEDELRILDLYQMISLDHHSKLNPHLNLHYLQHLRQNSLLQFKGLRQNGKIEGFVGYYIKNKILHCSILGYDRESPHKNHLYRLLSTMLLLEATSNANTFHQSAGASFFKTTRRAKGFQEYQAVYTKHLPWTQRCTWGLVKVLINTFAIPFMKKY